MCAPCPRAHVPACPLRQLSGFRSPLYLCRLPANRHLRPPPATQGCHPPPETVSLLCSTKPPSLRASHLVATPPRCLPCPRVNLSTGQLICLSLVHRASEPPGLSSCRGSSRMPPLPTCHRAHLPPLAFHASSPLHFAHLRPLPLLRSRSPCQHVPNAFPVPRMHHDRNHLPRHPLGMRDLRT